MFYRIFNIILGLLLPLLLGINLVFSILLDMGIANIPIVNIENSYFGFTSMYNMLTDLGSTTQETITFFFNDFRTWLDAVAVLFRSMFPTSTDEFLNGSGYTDFDRLGALLTGVFYIPYLCIQALLLPFTFVLNFLRVLLNAFLGYYNLPIPSNSTELMEIPNLLIVPINTLIQCMN